MQRRYNEWCKLETFKFSLGSKTFPTELILFNEMVCLLTAFCNELFQVKIPPKTDVGSVTRFWIRSSQKFPNCSPKCSNVKFSLHFQNSTNSCQIIVSTFERHFVTKKCPILATLQSWKFYECMLLLLCLLWVINSRWRSAGGGG